MPITNESNQDHGNQSQHREISHGEAPKIESVYIGPDGTRGEDSSATPPVPRPDVIIKDSSR